MLRSGALDLNKSPWSSLYHLPTSQRSCNNEWRFMKKREFDIAEGIAPFQEYLEMAKIQPPLKGVWYFKGLGFRV